MVFPAVWIFLYFFGIETHFYFLYHFLYLFEKPSIYAGLRGIENFFIFYTGFSAISSFDLLGIEILYHFLYHENPVFMRVSGFLSFFGIENFFHFYPTQSLDFTGFFNKSIESIEFI